MARSSYDGVSVRYVLPVSWLTLYFLLRRRVMCRLGANGEGVIAETTASIPNKIFTQR